MRQILRESVWTDRRLRRLPLELHLAWVFLLPMADHAGRFVWDMEDVRFNVHRDLDQDILTRLWEAGVITRYEVDGKVYGRFTPYLSGWPKSQAKRSRLPRPTPTNVIRRPAKAPAEPAAEVAKPVAVKPAKKPRPANVAAPHWLDQALLPVWRYYCEHCDEPDPMEFSAQYGNWKARMEGEA